MRPWLHVAPPPPERAIAVLTSRPFFPSPSGQDYGKGSVMSPTRDQLEESARKALAEVKDPRKAAALAAAGTAAAAAGLGLKRLRDGHGRAADSGAYRLLAGEPVGAGMKRVLAARVDDAIAQLRGETEIELPE